MTLADQDLQVTLTIQNRLGLHARPAMAFVELANRFPRCDIRVRKREEPGLDGPPHDVDGKSIMQMMMLAAGQGTQLLVTARGPQADEALRRLTDLVNRKFDEE